jgi:hypothetical protein
MKARTKQSHAVLSMALLVGAFAACQGLADVHTSAPPLASIHGTLSLGSNATAPTGDVKLAILWDVPTEQPSADTRDPSNPCAVDPLKLAKNPVNAGGIDFPSDLG